MSAPTVAVEWLLARAAVRQTGLLHVVSRRDTGALNPVCGANPIRSARVEEHTTVPAGVLVCADCVAFTSRWGGVDAFLSDYLGRYLELPITDARLSPAHARQAPGDVEALTDSIRQRGVVAPVIVRRVAAGFEVIDGARRIHAADRAGLTTVPAIVVDASDADAVLDGLVANLHREDLNPIELARAYDAALPLVGGNKAELGRRLGVSREQVSNTIGLLNLPDEDQARIVRGELTAEGGRARRRELEKGAAPTARLDDVAGLLAQLLAAKVAVTARGERTRIVIDVADADRDRILAQLGATAVAA